LYWAYRARHLDVFIFAEGIVEEKLQKIPNILAILWSIIVVVIFGYLLIALIRAHDVSIAKNIFVSLLYISFIFLSIISIFFKNSRRIISSSQFFVILAVFSLEFVLTITYHMRPMPDAAAVPDKRSKLAVVRDFRAEGVDAVPAFGFGKVGSLLADADKKHVLADKFYFGGIASHKTVLCNELGFWVSYDSDALGFNNPNEVWENGDLDVVMIGASNIHGHCVPSDKHVASLIRNRIPKTANLGLHGGDPLVGLGVLKEFVRDRTVRHVVMVFAEGNDNSGLKKSGRNPILRQYLKPEFSQELQASWPAINVLMERHVDRRMEQLKTNEVAKSRYWGIVKNFLRLAYSRRVLGILPAQAVDANLLRSVLGEARRFTEEKGGKFTLVYLPGTLRFKPESGLALGHDEIYRGVMAVVRELGVVVIDGVAEFSKHERPVELYNRHLSILGNQVLSELILESVEKK
jgi:hypothetical protein